MKNEFFTGYIDLRGVHISDGLKNKPVCFEVFDDFIALRWIHPTGLYEPSYLCELKMSKKQVLSGDYPFNIMNMGISALEALEQWRLNQ